MVNRKSFSVTAKHAEKGENDFRKSFSLFSVCLAVTENDFRLTSIFTFDPEMIFSPHFHFKAFPEKERERERARVRERGEETEQSVDLQAAPISSLSSRRRDLAKIAISRRRDIAISDCDREIAPSRARASDRDRRREIAILDRSRDRAVMSSRR